MIKYELICKNCEKSFDSWFASSKEYERLKKLKFINCSVCNSLNIQKSIMSPNVLSNQKLEVKKNKKYFEVIDKMKKYQKFIKKNLEYVGENFTYEARSIHYSDKKKPRGIYGKASTKEARELKEEGINVEIVPWINENEN